MKTLYFEGAGCSYNTNDNTNVGNYRIRTAFTNNEGKQIYLEMGNTPQRNDKDKIINEWGTRIDHLHYITDGKYDCNKNRISFDYQAIRTINYTLDNIKKWINKNLNCSFDNVIVLHNLAGYRVFGDNNSHNFGDTFEYLPELTQKRQEIHQHYYNFEKSEGKQFPNFSLWVDKEDVNILHLLRHFNGHNKHWIINTSVDNWIDTVQETTLGKYAC